MLLLIAVGASVAEIAPPPADSAPAQAAAAAPSAPHTPAPRGSIGAMIKVAGAEGRGAKLVNVVKNGPAHKAGLLPGDVVTAVNGVQISKPEDLPKAVAVINPGTTVTITYLRHGEQKQAAVTVLAPAQVFTKDAVGLDADAFRGLAKQGDADAQMSLAQLYAQGRSVRQDDAQAAVWYRKAAEQGNAEAQSRLGWMYFQGKGVAQDFPQALTWLRKGADQGSASAQVLLGLCYELGRGVPQDLAQAVLLYRKAAEAGYDDGQYKLGLFYLKGQGVPRDDEQAALWLRRAADQGQAEAQKILRQINESAAFSVAAKAWRENPAKPPLSPEVERLRQLAEKALDEQNIDAAVSNYEKGLELQPMWPEGWYSLGLLYAQQGNYAGASKCMRRYLELAPDAPDAKEAREQLAAWEMKRSEGANAQPAAQGQPAPSRRGFGGKK